MAALARVRVPDGHDAADDAETAVRDPDVDREREEELEAVQEAGQERPGVVGAGRTLSMAQKGLL